MTVMNRRSFALLGLGAGVAALAGCASSTPEPGAQSTGAGEPVTISNAFGTTKINGTPQKVVALGVNDADALLALGIVPVANTGYTYYKNGFGPWAEPLLEGATPELIDSDAEPDLEQIAALEPDLITALYSGIEQPIYDKLSALAPTLARPADAAPYGIDREQQLTILGQALGRQDKAAELIEQTDAAVAAKVAEHPEFGGRTGVVILPYDGQYGAYLPRDPRGGFLTSLGIEPPAAITELDDGETYFVPISKEQVPSLDGDVIIVIGAEDRKEFTGSASLFQQLDAKLIFADTDQRGAISYNSVLSVPYALGQLVPLISEAVAS